MVVQVFENSPPPEDVFIKYINIYIGLSRRTIGLSKNQKAVNKDFVAMTI